ncbi:major capsid protein [Pseudomonas guariconensis]|uniref:major capsid protein n=1 Tax=Pseudomonas guariconensis TaxID=1288410 RepID=UPI0025A9AF1C|nr:major capsid protein [Pseudomonas guariconensis]MDM9594752.1 major capsid protein [Pseudomonas guariconensis]MDM9607583.1 major capsid protein [Pseudomonas guariconensis]MDM9612540.1 major capsid protein [Pseudomonas guariconensis]
MALSNMKVFNEYLKRTTIETLAQDVEKFNASSAGAIRLTTQGIDGDFLQESFWAGLHGAQRRVDRYAANGAQASTPLAQKQYDSVKIAGGFGPILWEPSQLSWIQKNPEEALEVISRNLSEAIMADQLNTAISALAAAIGNQPTATNDVSATAGVTYVAINNAHALFGDASQRLVAQVMTGAMYHKLVGQNLANAERLFQFSGVQVVDILGKAVIITDAPALYEAGTPNKQKVLSLADGAAVVMDGSDLITNIETSNGKERIETTMQADYTFGLGLKGYTWDTANGGKSPTNAELSTGTNWDLVANSIKASAGVLTIGDATK